MNRGRQNLFQTIMKNGNQTLLDQPIRRRDGPHDAFLDVGDDPVTGQWERDKGFAGQAIARVLDVAQPVLQGQARCLARSQALSRAGQLLKGDRCSLSMIH